VAPMLGVRQRSSNGWRVAGKLVGDHDARLSAALAVKHPTQETLGSYLIASLLDKDVQYDSVLIDGSPEPVAVAADLERYFVQMPLVASSYSSSTQPCGEGGAELRAPLVDGFVADDDTAFGKEVLHVTKAEMEPKVQPHSVSDDFGREAVAPICRAVAKREEVGHQATLIAHIRARARLAVPQPAPVLRSLRSRDWSLARRRAVRLCFAAAQLVVLGGAGRPLLRKDDRIS